MDLYRIVAMIAKDATCRLQDSRGVSLVSTCRLIE